LAKTYWLYGVIIPFIFGFIISVIIVGIGKKGLLLAFIIILLFSVYNLFFLFPGIWNASIKYKGPKIWSILAKIAVIFGVITVILTLIDWWLLIV